MSRVKVLGVAAVAAACLLAACGGAQIPQHNGYKAKATPWKKAKPIELDAELKGKVEGDLDYGEMKRARWHIVELPAAGTLTVDLEVSPPTDDDFDMAMEILDSNFNVLAKADAEEPDANSLKKTRSLADLTPGTYYVHLYLEGRLDIADYELKVAFARVDKEPETDFPAHVAFVPDLPIVPLNDDTPVKPPKPPKPGKPGHGPRPPKPDPETETETGPVAGGATGPVAAGIMNVSAEGTGTKIIIAAGTDSGVVDGMKGSVVGVKAGGGFVTTNCAAKTCKAVVKATPDEVNKSLRVIIKP